MDCSNAQSTTCLTLLHAPHTCRSRPSSGVKRSASFVGADLHNIMDSQGMLHEGVSRQLSCMSHYRCACV